jgi:prephenate dehydratase|tara:strand:+ start:102 stop:962 length:861 start_codon:yes stop_codon:yes gene_type:complete
MIKVSKNNLNNIAFQGQSGAYSELACTEVFPEMQTVPCENFEDAFEAVINGTTKYAMIPIENSRAGRVADIHNLLKDCSLHIVKEYFYKVNHQLLGLEGAKISDIVSVFSHNQALSQCRNFIDKHELSPVTMGDTAGAAAYIAKNNNVKYAAIASSLAGKIHGLKALSSDIQDSKNNITRFVVLSSESNDPNPSDGLILTSCIFSLRNIPASLYKALGGFATNRVNILKLESYMLGESFTSAQFYIDIEGHPSNPSVQLALEELGFFSREVRILGVYKGDINRKNN